MTPRRNGVIVPDGYIGEPYETLKAVFLTVLTIFLVILSGIGLYALDIWRSCGFLFWVSDTVPRCLR